jgi:hypothetical protein
VRNNLGCTLLERATYELEHGIDPEPALRDAEKAFQETIRTNPTDPMPFTNLTGTYTIRARHVAATGGDPRELLERATELGEKGVAMNQHIASMYSDLATAWGVRAWNDRRHGRDPAPAIERARSRAEAAIRVSRKSLDARRVLAELELEMAAALVAQHRAPASPLLRARSYIADGLAINPASGELRLLNAESHHLNAEHRARLGQPVTADCAAGHADVNHVLAEDARSARAWATLAKLDQTCAAADADSKRRDDAVLAAKMAHQRAVELDRFIDGEPWPQ